MANITVEFEVGDVVSLNSDGPSMTVNSVKDDDIDCIWFSGFDVCRNTFLKQTLTLED
jgi:uncharacterized protein YodC (DUF2158 family)